MYIIRFISFALAWFTALFNMYIPHGRPDTKLIAEKIVAEMTLEEKIGQMIMPAFRTWTDENGKTKNVTALNQDLKNLIKQYSFGGVILFAENCAGTEQTTRLIADLQNTALQSKAGLKMFIAVDQEGGAVARLGTGCRTAGNMPLGALNSEKYTKTTAGLIGTELRAEGFNLDFAPDADINNDPSNPVIGVRSFSSSAATVSAMVPAFITGLHEEGIITCAKHFPGHGDTATDSHTGFPLISKTYDDIANNELKPFRAAISAGTDMIMTAHIQYPLIETGTAVSVTTGKKVYLPATLSKKMITGILRGKLGFEGVVTTDSMEMQAITDNFTKKDAAIRAINAGADILLMPVTATNKSQLSRFKTYIGDIVSAVNGGKISPKRITESAVRIVKLKIDRGILYDDSLTTEQRVSHALKTVGSKANHKTEMDIARKAVTLVKNSGVLPFDMKKSGTIPVFYPYSGEENCIAYAMKLIKAENPECKTEYKAYCYRYSSVSDYTSVIKNARAVVVCTECYGSSYLSPSSFQSVFADAVIKKAHALGKKVVLCSLQLPYDIARYSSADAIICCYGAKDMASPRVVYNGETPMFGVNIPAMLCDMAGCGKPQGRLPVDVYKLDSNGNYTTKIMYKAGTGTTYK